MIRPGNAASKAMIDVYDLQGEYPAGFSLFKPDLRGSAADDRHNRQLSGAARQDGHQRG